MNPSKTQSLASIKIRNKLPLLHRITSTHYSTVLRYILYHFAIIETKVVSQVLTNKRSRVAFNDYKMVFIHWKKPVTHNGIFQMIERVTQNFWYYKFCVIIFTRTDRFVTFVGQARCSNIRNLNASGVIETIWTSIRGFWKKNLAYQEPLGLCFFNLGLGKCSK